MVTYPKQVILQAHRAFFLTSKYWGKAGLHVLTAEVVGDTGVAFGYNTHGSVLLEEPGAVVEIDEKIAVVMSFCRCKGDCSSRRCSCVKKGENVWDVNLISYLLESNV